MVTETGSRHKDGWADQRDADHPIRWEPVDTAGRDPEAAQYLTLGVAVERLSRFLDLDPEAIADTLRSGRLLRTPFAFYQDDALQQVRAHSPEVGESAEAAS